MCIYIYYIYTDTHTVTHTYTVLLKVFTTRQSATKCSKSSPGTDVTRRGEDWPFLVVEKGPMAVSWAMSHDQQQ